MSNQTNAPDAGPDNLRKQFGDRLRTLRMSASLTQARLAELLGTDAGLGVLDERMIGYRERGERVIRHEQRSLLVGLVMVLHQCNAITEPKDADDWLGSGGYAPLTAAERDTIDPQWNQQMAVQQEPLPQAENTPNEPPANVSVTVEQLNHKLYIYNQSAAASSYGPAAVVAWLRSQLGLDAIDEHMAISWRGKFIRAVSTLMDRVTPVVLLWLLLCGLGVALLLPLLSWPLANDNDRLAAALTAVGAAVLMPLAVATLTVADRESEFQLSERAVRWRLYFLKLTGAQVAWSSSIPIVLLLVLAGYHASGGGAWPRWLLGALVVVCVIWSHVAAARIPADRYKMKGKWLDLHAGDRLFFVVFWLFGLAVPLCVYQFYDLLIQPFIVWIFGAALALVALLEWRKSHQATKNRPS